MVKSFLASAPTPQTAWDWKAYNAQLSMYTIIDTLDALTTVEGQSSDSALV